MESMNWLLIKSGAQVRAGTPSVSEAVLLKYSIKPHIVNSDERIDDSSLEEYYRLFSQVTHVIIADENYAVSPTLSSDQLEKQIFFLGLLSGRRVPVFSVSRSERNPWNPFVRCFSTEQKMAVVLNDDFSSLIRDERRSVSLNKLMCRGIPFTAASFADYIAKDNPDVCSLFLFAGIDVNARDDAGTPMLNVATRNGRQNMVVWLLENGADINAISRDRGYSAIMDAVWKKDEKLTALLVKKGADLSFISKEGLSILVLAVGIGSTAICRILAENGADPDVKDSMGMSAYEYAKLFKKEEIVSILEEFHRKDDR